ncbi:MAG TPA: hypothetical protein VF345_14765 [Chthoniobacterales bacterium]
MPQMELLALIAIGLMSLIGWVVATECLGKWIDHDSRFYFAPAFGMAACATIAYVASATRQMWLIPFFTFIALLAFFRCVLKKQPRGIVDRKARRLFNLTLLTLFCLYGIQISLFHLFKAIYPGPHEVWDLFNVSGVSPPDQMFAWHQAMFVDLHRHYPQDPFYRDMDLYDRPHLGGYLILFFFKLFHLPLTEDHYAYPAMALRFYHCFWWVMNNLYLFGIVPLFQRLFGYRGAVLAVVSTALSGFILLCNIGGWMKFSALYPFLLALLLFLGGKGPLLQAGLCATSYYLHGSVLPFLVGLGLFQILCVYYPIRPSLARFRDVAWFGFGGVVLIGAWFAVIQWVGSKQPLFYYYIYDAGLTQAQTQPVAQIAKAFYARNSWSSLSLLPLHNLINSVFPIHFFTFINDSFSSTTPWKISDLAAAIFESQRFCVLAAVGLAALPVVLVGLMNTLSMRYAGRTILVLYLIPSLLMALVYRIHWSFSLHIMCLYHTLVLFLWVSVLRNTRLLFLIVGLAAITFEGIICVLFSDIRFLPVHGIELNQLTAGNLIYLGTYLILLLLILGAACLEMRRLQPEIEAKKPNEPRMAVGSRWLVASRKLLVGLLITALTIASYSLYCLQFY